MAVTMLVIPGPVMMKHTPGLPRDARIAVGHEPGTLLVARGDVADVLCPYRFNGAGAPAKCQRNGGATLSGFPQLPHICTDFFCVV